MSVLQSSALPAKDAIDINSIMTLWSLMAGMCKKRRKI